MPEYCTRHVVLFTTKFVLHSGPGFIFVQARHMTAVAWCCPSVIKHSHPRHTPTLDKPTHLRHVDIEVEGEAAAAQSRQVSLVQALLAHPSDADG